MTTFKQGTDEWLEWRRNGLGSSDVAVVMGCSPYMTEHQLWQEKSGRKTFNQENTATFIGHHMEPIARSWYELENDMDMPEMCFEHPEYPFLRASLDGVNLEKSRFIEIKYLGKDAWADAKNGVIKQHHLVQMHHQHVVTGIEHCEYVAINTNKECHSQVVTFNQDLCNEIVKRCRMWWKKFVVGDKPPGLTDRDVVELSDPDYERVFSQLSACKLALDKAKSDYESLKESVANRIPHARVICGNVEMVKTSKGVRVRLLKN